MSRTTRVAILAVTLMLALLGGALTAAAAPTRAGERETVQSRLQIRTPAPALDQVGELTRLRARIHVQVPAPAGWQANAGNGDTSRLRDGSCSECDGTPDRDQDQTRDQLRDGTGPRHG